MTAVDPGVSERTRETNLRNAVERDRARRLALGLYASNVGAYLDQSATASSPATGPRPSWPGAAIQVDLDLNVQASKKSMSSAAGSPVAAMRRSRLTASASNASGSSSPAP